MKRVSSLLAMLAIALSLSGCDPGLGEVETEVYMTLGTPIITCGHSNGLCRLWVRIDSTIIESNGPGEGTLGGLLVMNSPPLHDMMASDGRPMMRGAETVQIGSMRFEGDEQGGEFMRMVSTQAHEGCHVVRTGARPSNLFQAYIHPDALTFDALAISIHKAFGTTWNVEDGDCSGEWEMDTLPLAIPLMAP